MVPVLPGCQSLCNGEEQLCDRAFSDVVFPTTHNANSALEYGYSSINANHVSGIASQLEAGVQAMMLDVTYSNGETVLCHGPCELGSTPHRDALADIHAHLSAHPTDVLTLLYQDDITPQDLEDDLKAAQLLDLTYTHSPDASWPTLGEMVKADTRLVVTAEVAGPPPEWLHHLWSLAFDTPYTFDSPEDFNCGLNRGDPENDLFLLNHWVHGPIGQPSQEESVEVNAYDVLHARAQDCWAATGRKPNFVAVDWFETGDLFDVVHTLNE